MKLRETSYETIARENQAGFLSKRDCRDQIFSLRQIVEQRFEFARPLVIIFINFKAAFDNVDRDAMWSTCSSLGPNDQLKQILKAMYSCLRSPQSSRLVKLQESF